MVSSCAGAAGMQRGAHAPSWGASSAHKHAFIHGISSIFPRCHTVQVRSAPQLPAPLQPIIAAAQVQLNPLSADAFDGPQAPQPTAWYVLQLVLAGAAAYVAAVWPMRPRGWSRRQLIEVRASAIEGMGVFARQTIPEGGPPTARRQNKAAVRLPRGWLVGLCPTVCTCMPSLFFPECLFAPLALQEPYHAALASRVADARPLPIPAPAGTVLGAYPGILRTPQAIVAKGAGGAPGALVYAFRTRGGYLLDPTDERGVPSAWPRPAPALCMLWPIPTDTTLTYVNEPQRGR
jgi:hypothetical protein